MMNTRALHLALRTRLLEYVDLPAVRLWENRSLKREAGTPYISDSFIPATRTLAGHMAIRGIHTTTGLYVLHWYGLTGRGLELSDNCDDVLALFPPGLSLVTSDGNAVSVRADLAPWRGQLLPTGDGWLVAVLTIPWTCTTMAAA